MLIRFILCFITILIIKEGVCQYSNFFVKNLIDTIPEVFAPDKISLKNQKEGNLTLNYNQDIIIYRIFDPSWNDPLKLIMLKLKDNRWERVERIPFDSEYKEWDFNFNRCENSFYFSSDRPAFINGELADNSNIWRVSLINEEWTKAELLDFPVNTVKGFSGYPSFANDGTMYFHSNRQGGYGGTDLYRTVLVNGKYSKVEHLSEKINTELNDLDPCISPDGRYLIFMSKKPSKFFEDGDMFISFVDKKGNFTKPIALGGILGYAGHPFISADGEWFFYTRYVNDEPDIYWIRTKVFNHLKNITECEN